jgi:hypothetical protein
MFEGYDKTAAPALVSLHGGGHRKLQVTTGLVELQAKPESAETVGNGQL